MPARPIVPSLMTSVKWTVSPNFSLSNNFSNKIELTENVALGDETQKRVGDLAGGASDNDSKWCFGHFLASLWRL